jgi:AcrR family transcriptional regulator
VSTHPATVAPVEPTRDTYRHGDLRAAGVEAAAALVEETGPGALSMREVARRTGVSHTAFYHHFPDKASLFAAVAEQGFAELTRTMTAGAARADDPLARLHAIGVGYVTYALRHPGVFRLMFRPELTGIEGAGVPAVVSGSWELLRSTVQECQQAGFSKDEHLDVLAILCWTSVHGLATLLLDGPLGPVGEGRRARATRVELAGQVVDVLNRLIRG